MITDRTDGSKSRDCRTMSADGADKSDNVVIPVHDPSVFKSSPSQTFHAQFDRRSNGSGQRGHFKALSDLHSILRNRIAVDCGSNLVNATVVFGDGERRI